MFFMLFFCVDLECKKYNKDIVLVELDMKCRYNKKREAFTN